MSNFIEFEFLLQDFKNVVYKIYLDIQCREQFQSRRISHALTQRHHISSLETWEYKTCRSRVLLTLFPAFSFSYSTTILSFTPQCDFEFYSFLLSHTFSTPRCTTVLNFTLSFSLLFSLLFFILRMPLFLYFYRELLLLLLHLNFYFYFFIFRPFLLFLIL